MVCVLFFMALVGVGIYAGVGLWVRDHFSLPVGHWRRSLQGYERYAEVMQEARERGMSDDAAMGYAWRIMEAREKEKRHD